MTDFFKRKKKDKNFDDMSAHQLEAKRKQLMKKAVDMRNRGQLLNGNYDKVLKLNDSLHSKIKEKRNLEQSQPQIIKNYTDKIKKDEVIARIPESTEHIKDEIVKKIPDSTKKIDTSKQLMKVKSGKEFTENIAKKRALKALGKFGKTGLKSLPLIGGVAAALSSGDVSAAVPVLGDIESLGPRQGTPEAVIEDMSATPEERMKAIKALKEKLGNNNE